MRINRVWLATAVTVATLSWLVFSAPNVAMAQEEIVAPDDSAAVEQDDGTVNADVVGPADYVGAWSGTLQDTRLGQGTIDVILNLKQTRKPAKPKLIGTYEIVVAGRDRHGNVHPKVDSTGALKLNFGFRIANRLCGVKATAVFVGADELSGTYRAGGCRSSGTFDVTR